MNIKICHVFCLGFFALGLWAFPARTAGPQDVLDDGKLRELSPEEIAKELHETDRAQGISTRLLESQALKAAGQGHPALEVQVYKSPRGYGIDKEFVVLYLNGDLHDVFVTSTGKTGNTPPGRYGIERRAIDWHSHTYHGAPMPFALFFHEGYAIHQTVFENYKYLGHPASHGCVRLGRQEALKLWNTVEMVHPQNVAIEVFAPGAQPQQTMIQSIERLLNRDYAYIQSAIKAGNLNLNRPTLHLSLR